MSEKQPVSHEGTALADPARRGAPEWALELLSERGLDSKSAFDDGENVDGTFGWTVERGGKWATLIVTFIPGGGHPPVSHRWRLVPVPDGKP